jgi:hypothetical protein
MALIDTFGLGLMKQERSNKKILVYVILASFTTSKTAVSGDARNSRSACESIGQQSILDARNDGKFKGSEHEF